MKTSTYSLRKILFCVLCLTGPFLGFSQQIEKGLTASNGKHVGFLEYKPADYSYTTTTRYPLIIFYHGIGERGNGTTDLYKVKRNGIPRYIDRGNKMRFYWNGKWETFIVLSPQLDASYGNWQNFYGEAMVAYAKKNLRIDTNRIFMAGLSLGGGGVWSYASGSLQNAETLAGIAPSCGVCTISNACNIARADLPVWAEHASDDPTVSVSCTINSISKINACNPVVAPIKIIYPTGGHAIWDRMFDTAWTWHDVNIYEWFLGQNKSLKPNILPVAKASGNTAVSIATGATSLSATASTDADGKLVRYVWKQLSGPSTAIIVSSKQATTNVTGLTMAGTYLFQLTVVDNRANWSRDTISIAVSNIIPNSPPIADAGADISLSLPTSLTTLDGTASSDPDGSIATSTWVQVSGPSAATIARPASLATEVSDLVEGTYQFRLTVTDNAGASSSSLVTVTVLPIPNDVPFVDAGSNVVVYLPEDSVTISGTGQDFDGIIASFRWEQVGGPSEALIINPNQSETDIRNLSSGIYQFRLTATDDLGGTASDTMVLTVIKSTNQAPQISIGKTVTIQLPVDSAKISGAGSFDPDGVITTYEWLQITGADGALIVHPDSVTTMVTGLQEGTYRYTLTITDNQKETATDTIKVIVLRAANQAPVAKAGTNILMNLPSTDTTLDGSESFDPEGSSLSYEWRKLKGPAGDSILNFSQPITSVSGFLEGMYVYELKVTDSLGASSLDTIRVTVKGLANVSPEADAGPDQTVRVTEHAANLDATASSDPDGTISSYQWSLVSGPTSIDITNSTAAQTLVTGLEIGDYLFAVVVTDNNGASSGDTMTIHVQAKPVVPPVAVAGADVSIMLPVDSVVIASTKSSDADGVIVSYHWELVSGPNTPVITNGNTSRATISNVIEGAYTFRLTVTDDDGATDTDDISITVLPKGNTKPIANAGTDRTLTLPLNQVSLDGAASYDPDGTLTEFTWTQVSGPSQVLFTRSDVVKASCSGFVPGTYTFRLTITDDGGLQASDDVKVIILKAPNKAPVANAGSDQQVSAGDDFVLDASASFDPDGSISDYNWLKISGNGGLTIINSGSAKPTVVGATPGTYIFQVTVTDNEGAESSAEVTVVVKSVVNVPPVADAGADSVVVLPAEEIELDASSSIDPDGAIVNYSWNQIDGPEEVDIDNPNGGLSIVSGIEAGTYVFELVVQDNDGAVSRDTVKIKVVSNLRFIDNVLAYPNPAVGQVTLRITADETGYTNFNVYDLYGRLILSSFTEKSSPVLLHTIPVNTLKAGLYLIEINIDDKKKMITRLVKQ